VEFLKPLGLTAVAKAIGVPPNRITAILNDERGITGDTAIRLGTFFKTSAEFWMNLQMTYDLRNAEKVEPRGNPSSNFVTIALAQPSCRTVRTHRRRSCREQQRQRLIIFARIIFASGLSV
jgi:antitoxin HigA-1